MCSLKHGYHYRPPEDLQNGPTELRPGSHVWADSPFGPRPRWDEATTATVSPELAVGEVLIFDYRTYHRGRANRCDTPRPVGYLVFSRRGVSDTHNFSSKSLVAAAAAAAAGGGGPRSASDDEESAGRED